jgi:FixJ family two-component response regulator
VRAPFANRALSGLSLEPVGRGMCAGVQPGGSFPALEGAVCVIDGDGGVRESLHALIGTLPVTVLTFSSAEEFLAHLDGGIPALLITELDLPGMSGFKLLEVLGSRSIHIPVLGLTCERDAEQEVVASRLGVVDLLEKPFLYWAVIQRIQEILGLPD